MVHIKNNWQYYEEDFVSIWDEVLFLKRLKNRAANIADIVRRVTGMFALASSFA